MAGDPVAFLEGALERAEELARAATEGPWGPQGDWSDDEVCTVLGGRGDLVGHPVAYVRAEHPGCLALDEAQTMANMRLIVSQADPIAVLRRVKADRVLLAEHAPYSIRPSACSSCGTAEEYPVLWPCRTVRLLAEAWGWEETT